MITRVGLLAVSAIIVATTTGARAEQNIAIDMKIVRINGQVVKFVPAEGQMEDSMFTSGEFTVQGKKGNIAISFASDGDGAEIAMSAPPGHKILYSPKNDETTMSLSDDLAEGSIVQSASPRVVLASGENASFFVADAPVHYFEPKGDDWELKRAASAAQVELWVLPRAAQDGAIRYDKLQVKTKTIVGRKPIAGTHLEAGKPIFDETTTDFKLTATQGTMYWMRPKVDDSRGELLVGISATLVDDPKSTPE